MCDKEKLRSEILVKEYEIIGQATRTLFLSSEKAIALGFTILGTGFIIGIKEKIEYMLLFLPFAVFGVLLYDINIATELGTMGGYKRYLEERINSELKERILLWELFLSEERHKSLAKKLSFPIYLIFTGLTVYFSLATAWESCPKWFFWCLVCVFLGFALGLISSVHKSYKAFAHTYEKCKRLVNQSCPRDCRTFESAK
jgi:hypothetical protein